MDDLAWQTVARLLQRIQFRLDHPWDLEEMARVTGYQLHHLAHLFREVVGEPPAQYVRRLRLERAAAELLEGALVADVASRAAYRSAEGFSRAFRRQFGDSPTRFVQRARRGQLSLSGHPAPQASGPAAEAPPGLAPQPRIEAVGPLAGWTVIVPSFAPERIASGMGLLMAACPPDGPWLLGGISQPWGWLTDEAREFRCLRLRERDDRAPPPPLMPWSWPRAWFAVFDYAGPLDQIEASCEWMATTWPSRVGLRLGYGPLFSLLEGQGDPHHVRARLHLAVSPLTAARPDDSAFGERL